MSHERHVQHGSNILALQTVRSRRVVADSSPMLIRPNEAYCPMISPDFVFNRGESVRVFSKSGLILQSLLCRERVGFGPIHANQQFGVFAILLFLLEP